jgi:hypothetical protein
MRRSLHSSTFPHLNALSHRKRERSIIQYEPMRRFFVILYLGRNRPMCKYLSYLHIGRRKCVHASCCGLECGSPRSRAGVSASLRSARHEVRRICAGLSAGRHEKPRLQHRRARKTHPPGPSLRSDALMPAASLRRRETSLREGPSLRQQLSAYGRLPPAVAPRPGCLPASGSPTHTAAFPPMGHPRRARLPTGSARPLLLTSCTPGCPCADG